MVIVHTIHEIKNEVGKQVKRINTGLKDKNKKSIHVGDILKITIYKDFDKKTGQIEDEWNEMVIEKNRNFFITSSPSGEPLEYYTGSYSYGECEVIGNILENPNLIDTMYVGSGRWAEELMKELFSHGSE